MSQYERHVFVCTDGKRCARRDADAVLAAFKKQVAAAGLKGRVRVNRAGCLGQCAHGPMAVVYPEAVWYAALDGERAAAVAAAHLVAGCPLDRWRHVAPPGDHEKG